MDKPLGVALVGCGRISRTHANALAQIEEAELRVVVDVIPERAEKLAAEFGAEPCSDFEAVLERDDVDVVEICTPHYLHAPMAIAAAQAGKHALTEKPMAIKPQDAQEMIEAARRAGTKLGVIFQNRYNDASQAVRRCLQEGRLGEILGARAYVVWSRDDSYYAQNNWQGKWATEGGGVLINQAIHTLDLLQWLMGGVSEVYASFATRTHKAIEVEDVIEALLVFRPDVHGLFYATTSYSHNAPVFLEIHGSRGLACIQGDTATITTGNTVQTVHQSSNGDNSVALDYWGSSHLRQIKDFYRSVLAGEDPVIDGAAGSAAVKLVDAIYRAGREGRAVKVV